MQQIEYDALGEHVARRSVPVSEGTAENQILYDLYDHDAAGREVRHTTPWNEVVETSYAGLIVAVEDQLGKLTTVEQDPLGRPVTTTDAAQGVTRYSYGPFGMSYTVTTPGNALTRTTRDAYGRVQRLDDPDRGTTLLKHDGFGELISSTDALGRVMTRAYDVLGRPLSRTDQEGAQVLATTWTWDTAANGIGKLQSLASPDGEKTRTYNARGQLETLTLPIEGESEPLQAKLRYDKVGHVETITYPTPAGTSPFVLVQDYDDYGHVLAVRDQTTKVAYWRLTDVDDAGRFRKEMFGNGVSTERSYFADKQSLKSIVTQRGTTTVQDLAYR